MTLTACGSAPTEPDTTPSEPPVSTPATDRETRPPDTSHDRIPVDMSDPRIPDLGEPKELEIYIPTRDELERRLAEARAAAEARESSRTTRDTPGATPVDPVLPPDVVTLPDRGPVEPLRPLDKRLAALLRALERNDIRAAHRELKSLDARDLAPQDRFLLQGLQAYIYFRLGDDEVALKLMRKVVRELEDTMPLSIGQARLVRGPRNSIRFGKYVPVAESQYKVGGTFYLYLEPGNVVQLLDGDRWKVSLEVDFTLKDQKGNVVHDMERVHGIAFEQVCNDALKADTNLNRREDLYYAFHIPVPRNLNPMTYTLEVTLRDCNTDPRKEATASLDLTLE